MLSYFFPALGAAVALAGGDKLVGVRGYQGMFHRLGWSRADMQAAAAAEVLGGLLMIAPTTRRLGGAVVATTSAVVLGSEINHGNSNLAVSRSIVLLLALAATAKRLSLFR